MAIFAKTEQPDDRKDYFCRKDRKMALWEKYQHVIRKINYFALLVLTFSLPFPRRYIAIAWMVWIITWTMEFRILKKSNFHFGKPAVPALLLCILTMWEILSMLWADNAAYCWNSISNHLYFFVLFFILVFGVNENYNAKTALKTLIAGGLASTVFYISAIRLGYDAESMGDFFPYYAEAINDYKHRLYYSTTLTLGCIGVFFVFGDMRDRLGQNAAIAASAAILAVLTASILMTGSRTSIVTLVVCFAMAVSYAYRRKKISNLAFFSLFATVCCCILLYFTTYHRMKNVTGERIQSAIVDKKYDETTEPRLYIWNTALQKDFMKRYFWYGVGAGNSQPLLVAEYKARNMEFHYNMGWGTHNQYLCQFMELGIFGLLFFLAAVVSVPFFYCGTAMTFALYLSTVLGLDMVTETILYRQEGVLVLWVGVMLAFILQKTSHGQCLCTNSIQKAEHP